LAEGPLAWGLPVFVLGEFLRVATHPRYLEPPSSLTDAVEVLDGLLASPSVQLLAPGPRFWWLLRETALTDRASGNAAFDAQIAAVCLEQGARTVLTEDRGMRRFTGIEVRALAEQGNG
jgi:uncharacterized protein